MEELIKQQKKLEAFLKNYKEIGEYIPTIQKILETTNFNVNILKTIPESIEQETKEELANELNKPVEYLALMPDIPEMKSFSPATGLTYSISASTSGYSYLSKLSFEGGVIGEWANYQITEFDKIQDQETKIKAINSYLKSLNPQLADLFLDSLNKFAQLSAGTENQRSVAFITRTVLEKHNGELIERTRKHLSKSIKVTWPVMSEHLAINGKGSNENILLQEQHAIYNKLKDLFTDAGKNFVGYKNEYIILQKPTYLNHLYTILNLIDDTKI